MLRTLFTVALLLLASPPTRGASWHFEARAAGPTEEAVRAAATVTDPETRVAALLAAAERHPDTTAAGLARLAAGLIRLEEERYEEALVQLAHADVRRTAVADHGLLGLARAQEALERKPAAGRSFLAAAHEPMSAVTCTALPQGAALLAETGDAGAARTALEGTIEGCPSEAPDALLELGLLLRKQGRPAEAAALLDRLDDEHPGTEAARKARSTLVALAPHLPRRSPSERALRGLRKGRALLAAGRTSDAHDVLRRVDVQALPVSEVNPLRLALGRALLARRRYSAGRAVLGKIPAASPLAPEAAYYAARSRARGNVAPYASMAEAFPGTPWAERALRAAANHLQSAARDDEALPWWRHVLAEYPDGLYTESAAWRVGWGDYREKRFDRAGYTWERAARVRAPGSATPALLYWAARAHLARGEHQRARWLLEETVQRFKHSYHGLRAQEHLARLGVALRPAPAPATPDTSVAPVDDPPPGPARERLRQLLLVDLFDQAAAELHRMGRTPGVLATLGWVEWKRERLRPAIQTIQRAFPHWVSAAGDHLPREIWEILFPLRFEADLRKASLDEGVDPSLVAALILQESTFDPDAVSRAGARGLMQIMPRTGRDLARAHRIRYRTSILHDPRISLDFGTYYLRQMSDRFDGAVDKVLAGYNAGARRVDRWTERKPGLGEEEFIETIPFTETRFYVRIVLANREQYRRLYGLGLAPAGSAGGGARP